MWDVVNSSWVEKPVCRCQTMVYSVKLQMNNIYIKQTAMQLNIIQ